MRFFKLFLFLLVFVSCSPIYVNYDYENGHDFSKYKTYNYYQDIQTGLSELDTKRLFKILDETLLSRGFTLSETPDFFIDISSSDMQNTRRNTVGIGVGGTGGNVGGGISLGIPVGQNQIDRQIVFEFVDENGIGLFWQAISESSFNEKMSPEKRVTQLKAITD